MTKLTEIPIEPNAAKAAAEKLKREMPQYIENMKLLAKLRKEAYDAHLAAGFTPTQALELCRYS